MSEQRGLKLILANIYCFLTDETGFDDLYLVVSNKKVWPKSHRFKAVRPGRTKVNVEIPGFNPGDQIEVEIWDFDYISRNDLLGKVPVFLDEPGGPYTTDMVQNTQETKKAKYSLEWEIDFE